MSIFYLKKLSHLVLHCTLDTLSSSRSNFTTNLIKPSLFHQQNMKYIMHRYDYSLQIVSCGTACIDSILISLPGGQINISTFTFNKDKVD